MVGADRVKRSCPPAVLPPRGDSMLAMVPSSTGGGGAASRVRDCWKVSMETFQQSRTRLAAPPPPVLLGTMASMLSPRGGKTAGGQDRFTLSAPTMRSLLDSLASRLDESRELSRYMTGLLIFLGLLGTFWGLLLTVSAVSDVIGGMSVGS